MKHPIKSLASKKPKDNAVSPFVANTGTYIHKLLCVL